MRNHVRPIALGTLVLLTGVTATRAGTLFTNWSADASVGTYAWIDAPFPPQSESCTADSTYGGTLFLSDELFCESEAIYGYAGCTVSLDGYVTGSQTAMTASAGGGTQDWPFADCGGSFTGDFAQTVAVEVTGNGAVRLAGEVSMDPFCVASVVLRNAGGVLAQFEATGGAPVTFDEIVNLPEGSHELVVHVQATPTVSGGPNNFYGGAAAQVTATATFPVAAAETETLPWSRVKALYR